jgi:hypothetical protein
MSIRIGHGRDTHWRPHAKAVNRAAKDYECACCHQSIPKGQPYARFNPGGTGSVPPCPDWPVHLGCMPQAMGVAPMEGNGWDVAWVARRVVAVLGKSTWYAVPAVGLPSAMEPGHVRAELRLVLQPRKVS